MDLCDIKELDKDTCFGEKEGQWPVQGSSGRCNIVYPHMSNCIICEASTRYTRQDKYNAQYHLVEQLNLKQRREILACMSELALDFKHTSLMSGGVAEVDMCKGSRLSNVFLPRIGLTIGEFSIFYMLQMRRRAPINTSVTL
jgi:hypothetical protein